MFDTMTAADMRDEIAYMLPVPAKRGRKPKRQSEKEVMREHGIVPSSSSYSSGGGSGRGRDGRDRNDSGGEEPPPETVLQRQRRIYENIQYLSGKERAEFDNKFCRAKNANQQRLLDYLNTPKHKIVIATGPAGTGKSLLAVEAAVRGFLLGTYDKIVFTRPTVSVDDEELGFLPGDIEAKMAPWMRPLYDVLYGFMTPKDVAQLIDAKVIEICPLAFMRGRTFKNCCIVADECQNATQTQMKMLMTRIGEGTRLFVTGDLEQCDRKGGEVNGLEDFLDKIRRKRSASISSIEFGVGDVEREEIVREVLEIYAMDHGPPSSGSDTDSCSGGRIESTIPNPIPSKPPIATAIVDQIQIPTTIFTPTLTFSLEFPDTPETPGSQSDLGCFADPGKHKEPSSLSSDERSMSSNVSLESHYDDV
jgi:phosphate starvation-inducible PhoH-like protein